MCRGPGLPIFTLLIISHIAIVANANESEERVNMSVFSAGKGMGRPS